MPPEGVPSRSNKPTMTYAVQSLYLRMTAPETLTATLEMLVRKGVIT
jgi:hypothetical protein